MIANDWIIGGIVLLLCAYILFLRMMYMKDRRNEEKISTKKKLIADINELTDEYSYRVVAYQEAFGRNWQEVLKEVNEYEWKCEKRKKRPTGKK